MVAIPITVLTGFLGSGKTTLLRTMLQDPAMAGTAVIINEFGEVGLDGALVEKADEDTIVLPSGCVCCTVRGDLTIALAKLHRQSLNNEIPTIKRVVLETSGLADPSPIAHTIMTDEDTYRVYQLDGIVTTVDAQHGLQQLESNYEPAKQIALADRIVITKTDLATPQEVQQLKKRVRDINRTCKILQIVKGESTPSELFDLGAHEPALTGADPDRWLGHSTISKPQVPREATHHHNSASACTDPTHSHLGDDHQTYDHQQSHPQPHNHHNHCAPDCDAPNHAHAHLHGIETFDFVFDKPLDGNALSLSLQTLAAAYGDKLLRVKGIVSVENQSKPFVVHGVQHVFYPPDVLKEWPQNSAGEPDKRSRFVFITRELSRVAIAKHLKPFLGDPTAI